MVSTSWRPPPNWPTPPDGWVPPPDWQPDPAWGPAPPGWSFWLKSEDAASLADSGPDEVEPGLVLGHRAARKWRRAEPALRACLDPGEEVRGFFLANTLRPLTDYIAVTSDRLLAGAVSDLTRIPARLRSAYIAAVAAIDSEPAAVSRLPKLTARRHDGSQELLGQLMERGDEPLLRSVVDLPTHRPGLSGSAAVAPLTSPPETPTSAAAPQATDGVRPPATRVEGTRTEKEAQIQRLIEASVIDDNEARYIRSVLFS